MNDTIPDIHEIVQQSREAADKIAAQTRARKERELKLKEAQMTKEVDRLVPIVSERIRSAATIGRKYAEISFDADNWIKDSIYKIANILRNAGYSVFTRYDTVDYGDSAAPCVRDRINLDIKWK